MLVDIGLLAIGYSLVAAGIIATTHLATADYRGLPLSRIMGLLLLLVLALIQLHHYTWLRYGHHGMQALFYTSLLFLVAPAFHLFSMPILVPDFRLRWMDAAHALPLLIAFAVPAELARPLAFAIGAAYLTWLARTLLPLRAQRAGFSREIALLGLALIIALATTAMMLLAPTQLDAAFIALYAIAIAGALLLVQLTLTGTPHLTEEVEQAARTAYAHSTLGSVDLDARLTELERQMHEDRVYQDPTLDLRGLAARLELTPHQLSELINLHLGKGFSRYLREKRLAAARETLIARPSKAVLDVALSVGFNSQSSFYAAFREAEGMSPGQYREVHRARS